MCPGDWAVLLLPLPAPFPKVRQTPYNPAVLSRCYGDIATFRDVLGETGVAERESGHWWLFLGLSGRSSSRTDGRTDDWLVLARCRLPVASNRADASSEHGPADASGLVGDVIEVFGRLDVLSGAGGMSIVTVPSRKR